MEGNLTWLIIVDNSDSRFGVMSLEFRVGIDVIKLHIEVLIWLPVIIILNSNVKSFAIFTIELNDSIESVIVFASLSITIDGSCSNSTNDFFLVDDMDTQFTR